ncbi:MAG: protein-export chaperone SecB, partial [Deltaproteobacteria bacterium]
ERWKTQIGIRQPAFFKSTKQYVGGLDITLNYPNPEIQKTGVATETGQLQDIVKLSIGISGVFTVEEGRFEKAIEESLVKIQIPALLFPYLRSAITSILAHAGLGSVLFPLINIQELAKNANLMITEME